MSLAWNGLALATRIDNRADRAAEDPMSTASHSELSQRARLSYGQPVSDLMARALADPELISLAAGFVDQQTLPGDETYESLRALFSSPTAAQQALQYGTTAGYPPLREAIVQRLQDSDGHAAPYGFGIEQVVLTAGSNQLLHLVAETLLDPGDVVCCSSPTYFVFLGTLRNLGAEAIGLASDEAGLIPEALDDQLRTMERRGELERVKAVYLVSYFDNPRGITLSAERREQIVEICRRWSCRQKIYLIDDAAYRELRYRGTDVPSLLRDDPAAELTIATGTFSKSFSPGLRVGWGILPTELVEPVCNQKGNIDFGSPNFNQHLMHQVLQLGWFDKHVERIREAYRGKMDAMLSAAERWLSDLPDVHWIRPEGGLYVWVELPAGLDAGPAGPLFARALEEGVIYVPGEYCFPPSGQPVRKHTIRLSFGVQTPDRIDCGMQALGRAIRDVLNDVPRAP